jgi:hypothetical protein
MFWDGDEDMEKQQKESEEYTVASSEKVKKVMDEITKDHDELFKKLAKS